MAALATAQAQLSPEDLAAIQRALARRQGGQPTPALNQQVSGVGQAPQPAQLPQPQTQGVSIPQAGAQAKPPPAETEIIVRALGDRLKSISKVETAQTTTPFGGM